MDLITLALAKKYAREVAQSSASPQEQVDWDQNDDSAVDYVKNRPFYKKINYTEIKNEEYILTKEENGIKYDSIEVCLIGGGDLDNLLLDGAYYEPGNESVNCMIEINGVQYRCTMGEAATSSVASNMPPVEGELPFGFSYQFMGTGLWDVSLHTYNLDNNGKVSVKYYYGEEIIKQLDEKYISSDIPRVSDIKPDWNENDEESIHYIENRTHYKERKMVSQFILENTSFSSSSATANERIPSYESNGFPFDFSQLQLDDASFDESTFIVTFDGAPYECYGLIQGIPGYGDIECLGNVSLIDENILSFSDEPFAIGFYNTGFHIYTQNQNTHTISIQAPDMTGVEIHQLNEEYIPETIARIEAVKEYVNSALTSTVLITITPALNGITATLTNSESGNIYTGLSNELGQISISLKEYGTYTIAYNNPSIKSTESIIISEPGKLYTILATYTVKSTYTLRVDLSNSNPLTACEYLDAASGMTKGSTDWDTKSIFNEIRPCVFKDGAVNYYLNPNDFNYKLDGTPADLTGADGDVMIEFGKFAYRIYTNTEENAMYVSITNDEDVIAEDNRYHYYAFTRESEGDLEHFYCGAFKGSLDENNKLRSIAGATPAHTANIGSFTQYAESNGDNYTISNYPQLVALQCLYLIKYGNLNSQSALGNGYTSASAATATGQTLDKGMYYGSTANSTTQVKFAGIEDFWGNIWEWVNGLTTDSSWNVITEMGGNTYTQASGLTANSSGYVTKVIGTTEGGFMNIAHGGSSTTYFSDNGYLCAGRVLIFGGRWGSGAYAGVFFLLASDTASGAGSGIGARLIYV